MKRVWTAAGIPSLIETTESLPPDAAIRAAVERRFHNYIAALIGAGAVPVFHGVPEACDALLLPGGGDLNPRLYGQENRGSHPPDDIRDALDLQLLDRFVTLRKPVLGICRGIQVLNVFFGGTLLQDIPSHHQIQDKSGAARDRIHPIRTAAGSPFADLGGPSGDWGNSFSGLSGQSPGSQGPSGCVRTGGGTRYAVNSAHHQAADRIGTGLVPEQWAEDGIPEGIRHRSLPLWGVQWHPERLPGPVGRRLFHAFLSL